MKSLFGLGGKLKDKLSAVKFEFTVTIHNLQPWPDTGNRSVAIGWQRGKEKRGATRSVYLSPSVAKLGNVARFNEKFELTATLYKSSSGTQNASQLGPFKKKCLILAILEMDARTQATAVLGRVVIDLSEFAAHDKQEVRFFMVTCNRQIHAAVGDPQLLITIRARLKRVSEAMRAGGDNEFRDDGSAMSADTTGSRMTDNLQTFWRGKVTGRGPINSGLDNEQDLSGFSRNAPDQRASTKTREADKAMNAIDESQEDDERAVADPFSRKVGEPLNKTALVAPRTRPSYGSDKSNGHNEAMPTALGGVGLVRSEQTNGSPHAGFDDTNSSGLPTPLGVSQRGHVVSHAQHMGNAVEGANTELILIAASEISVHMARAVAASSKRLDRAAHAAARRFVRTVVCLGPQQGSVFGQHVLRLINTQIECSTTDLGTLAFWWSNLAHTRALLHQCASTDAMPTQVADHLSPQVAALEKSVFDYVVTHLWEGVLLPAVTDATAATSRAGAATAASRRAQQEAAIKRWFEGLKQVNSRLTSMVAFMSVGRQRVPVQGHVAQLRQQALLQCLKRVDALLFYQLMQQPGRAPPDLMADYDPTQTLWGAPGTPPANLEDASVPFAKGLLTFGAGMSVKMTVTRLQQWATAEGGVPDFGVVGASSSSLFPLLKATADLLMMPKDLLREPAIRRDTYQALSIRSIQHILAAFQPDEYAVDAISPDVLRDLQEEELRMGSERPTLTDLSAGYRPPQEDHLLLKVTQGMEPSIEYDADSEDELVGFSNMAAPQGGGARFRLLHDLWYANARFKEAASVCSSSRLGSVNHPNY